MLEEQDEDILIACKLSFSYLNIGCKIVTFSISIIEIGMHSPLYINNRIIRA